MKILSIKIPNAVPAKYFVMGLILFGIGAVAQMEYKIGPNGKTYKKALIKYSSKDEFINMQKRVLENKTTYRELWDSISNNIAKTRISNLPRK